MSASYWDTSSRRWTQHNLQFYHTRFLQDSTRIFSSEQDELEILQRCCTPRREAEIIESKQAVSKEFQEGYGGGYIYIIRQNNSWARVNLKQKTFEQLLLRHDVFPPFLDAFHSFGFKIGADEKVWDGFHSDIMHSDGVHTSTRFQFSYNLRYVEKHGRISASPWSLRQFGVYHSVNSAQGEQTMIFIQPPESLYQLLKEIASKNSSNGSSDVHAHPLSIHIAILSRMLHNWDEYIAHLRGNLMALDDKACFSRVGVVEKAHDYPVAFADKQKLQLFRHELFRTISVFSSSLEIANSMAAQLSRTETAHSKQQTRKLREKLNSYCAEIRRLRRSSYVLVKISDGTAELLSKILEFRNDRVQTRTSEAMHSSLATLNQLASESALIAERSQKDSKILKALTVAATMYLPATLIATIFSSNLVQLRPDGEDNDTNTHFRVANQFWVYILLTSSLTAVTVVLIALLSKRRRVQWLSSA